MRELQSIAQKVAGVLKARQETVAVAESSAGGLVSAALLSVPGASSYFVGGNVLYTRRALLALKGTQESMFEGLHGATEAWALLMARTVRDRCAADWALAETGAAGPAGNRYGDSPGHAWVAVSGTFERAQSVETGSADRIANMYAFARAALELLAVCLQTGRSSSR